MKLATRRPDGRIEIPTAEPVEDGGWIAHGAEVIGPADPRFSDYDAWLRQQERAGVV